MISWRDLKKERKNKCITSNEMLYCFKASQTFDYQVALPVLKSGNYPLEVLSKSDV